MSQNVELLCLSNSCRGIMNSTLETYISTEYENKMRRCNLRRTKYFRFVYRVLFSSVSQDRLITFSQISYKGTELSCKPWHYTMTVWIKDEDFKHAKIKVSRRVLSIYSQLYKKSLAHTCLRNFPIKKLVFSSFRIKWDASYLWYVYNGPYDRQK